MKPETKYPYKPKPTTDIEEKEYYRRKREAEEEELTRPAITKPIDKEVYIPREERPEDRERKAAVTEIRKALVRERTRDIEPLQFVSDQIIGDLFDRVEFLKERVEEMNQAILSRQSLNQQINDDIDLDIQKKQALLNQLSNKEDVRELQLDISLLKMEKRKENTLLWRDLVTLKKELMDLVEQYKVESKIAGMFGGMR
jgi:hypothetical protein